MFGLVRLLAIIGLNRVSCGSKDQLLSVAHSDQLEISFHKTDYSTLLKVGIGIVETVSGPPLQVQNAAR